MKKLLKLLASLAIVFSLVQVSPVSAAGETVRITTAEELAAALLNQDDNQVWEIESGVYDLNEAILKAPDSYYNTIKQGGQSLQSGWYFPIVKNGITIKGVGAERPVITSSYATTNGAWASQDFLTVWADDVTVENVNIQAKEEMNKAIEIMGKNFTLRDVEILKQAYAVDGYDKPNRVYSGSIYFNPLNAEKSVGAALLENVTWYGGLSSMVVKDPTSTITLRNAVLDWTDNWYSDYSDAWRVLSGRTITDSGKDLSIYNVEGFTVVMDNDIANIEKQILEYMPSGSTLQLAEDIELKDKLIINNDGLTIDGNGFTITASPDFVYNTAKSPNMEQLITLENAQDITFKDVTIKTTDKNSHALNVFQSTNVILDNVALDHEIALKGAPLVVNSSTVTVMNDFDLTLGKNSWYAINIENKYDLPTSIDFSGVTNYAIVDTDERSNDVIILSETMDKVTITAEDKLDIVEVEKGVLKKAEYTLSFANVEANERADFGDITSISNVVLTLKEPSKVGYTFAGWYIDSKFTGTAVDTAAYVMPKANTTLYAKWTPNTYKVTFNGVNQLFEEELVYDQVIDLGKLPIPELAGYRFMGWNTLADGKGVDLKQGDIYHGELQYQAKWAKEFELRLDTMVDGKAGIDEEIHYLIANETIALPIPTPRTGYTFKGWNVQADGKGQFVTATSAYTIDKDTTLYAIWEQDIVKPNVAPKPEEKKSAPATGDTTNVTFLFSMLVMAGAAIIVLRKREVK